jgi:phosphate transport system permease protein
MTTPPEVPEAPAATDAAVDLTPSSATHVQMQGPRLPRFAPLLAVAVAIAAGVLLGMLILGSGPVTAGIFAALLFIILFPAWSFIVEGRRSGVDRLVTSLIWVAFAVVVCPLIWLIYMVLRRGLPAINGEFLNSSMLNVVGPGGGLYHALIGTLIVTLFAALISVPIGLFTAIYLVEYGKKSTLARTITFLVDVMTGIPSIVAGLFALSLFVLIAGPAYRAGIMGSVALSLLMIPTVVRSAEEMLRLVPNDLREASYALGVPKWRTIVKVVLPTSIGGIITGIVLAISRVIGETAPLLVAVGTFDRTNFNPFSDRMMTLPVYIFQQFSSPGIIPVGGGEAPGYGRAWGAALILIVIVMVLNAVARIIGKIFAPKTGR